MMNISAITKFLGENEALAEFTIAGEYRSGFCIIPDDVPAFKVDIMGCLEETLHRFFDMEEDSADDLIYEFLLADQEETDNDDDNVIEIDLGYRIHGQMLTFIRVPLSAVSLQRTMYERYKLIWMEEHGITLEEAFTVWRDFLDSANSVDNRKISDKNLFEQWETDYGFSGSLYPCFEEFVDAEYQLGNDHRLFCSNPYKQETELTAWRLDQKARLR